MSLVVVLVFLTALWILSVVKRDASIIDPFWGMGFVIVASLCWWSQEEPNERLLLLVTMTIIWGVRLSLHLLVRNWGKGEDYRYAKMRTHHGNSFWWKSVVTVFWLQGVLLWTISLPVQVAALHNHHSPLGLLDLCGALLWFVGLTFEAVADWQLTLFRKRAENRGKVLDRGLWRYTRHPNYFGDFCVWWGIYIVACSGGAWATIASPLLMSFLLLKISGVAMLERDIVERRPEYARYRQETNAFFPGPRRSAKSDSG